MRAVGVRAGRDLGLEMEGGGKGESTAPKLRGVWERGPHSAVPQTAQRQDAWVQAGLGPGASSSLALMSGQDLSDISSAAEAAWIQLGPARQRAEGPG